MKNSVDGPQKRLPEIFLRGALVEHHRETTAFDYVAITVVVVLLSVACVALYFLGTGV